MDCEMKENEREVIIAGFLAVVFCWGITLTVAAGIVMSIIFAYAYVCGLL
jgi:hypothetical protein